MSNKEIRKFIIACVMVLLSPLIAWWGIISLNILFELGIPITLKTIAAGASLYVIWK